jgi:hypothetical protein
MQVDLPQPVGPTRKTNSPPPDLHGDPLEAHGAAAVDLRDVVELDDRKAVVSRAAAETWPYGCVVV